MAGTPFQIPGLGQAKPNEQLPVENFAPDLLAAAASIMGESGVTVSGTNGDAQWGRKQQQQQQQQQKAAEATENAGRAANSNREEDGMEVDNETNTLSAAVTGDPGSVHEQDSGMHDQESSSTGGPAVDVEMKTNHDTAPSPSVTHALEAALDGMLSSATGTGGQPQQEDAGDVEQAEDQEWEVDSSPYESSSDSSSSDSSSDEDSEDEGGYPLLGIEETARLLMAADGEGEGDGDGTGKSKGAGSALRTKNEIPEEVIPKPNVTITPDMKIELLGNVQFIVENTAVIKSQAPGEVQVLDSGSVLCREDRTVIGALAEILGNVRSPLYTVGFATEDEIKELELAVGTPVFYSVQHANYVFTQPLRETKGTDASNLHDEEVAADEMEFSDDEKEADTEPANAALGAGLNYDEDDDGPYKPLARPPGFGQFGPPPLAALPPKPESGFSAHRGGHSHGQRSSHRGARGDFRGRNGRGGFRGGDRRPGQRGGRGGSYQQFGRDGPASPQAPMSSLPLPPAQNPHLPPPPFGAKPPTPTGQWPTPPPSYATPPVPYPHSPSARPQVTSPHQPPSGNFTFNYQAWTQNQGQQYQYPQTAQHPQSPLPQQPSHPTGYGQPFAPPAWPVAGATPPAPPAVGAYNPAFYGGYQHGQQTQQGQQYWPQQQRGAYGQGPGQ
ncbi:H/ACA ribonucleoprotein complex non-core subunit NAF1 [Madurella mycetomatis]|uniref:H/ACA ribonucleoprotein complex non-core subunit NAF1 n=1 Tax=Madurella mycetomatis TaxID=100816 RepID=A0A175VY46_9PEZI|nr:H/ACA ribonucleoprotein complex non-core subunit NAF1 [Madurella mycetomatis]